MYLLVIARHKESMRIVCEKCLLKEALSAGWHHIRYRLVQVYQTEIPSALSNTPNVLLVLSKEAETSRWVQKEWCKKSDFVRCKGKSDMLPSRQTSEIIKTCHLGGSISFSIVKAAALLIVSYNESILLKIFKCSIKFI